MSECRQNTLVVDFGVLPSRPETSAVESFLMQKMKLKMSDVRILQFHNIHHCVFIEMVNIETALCYQKQNNRKHTIECNGNAFAIPVYVEDGAVTVRIHDLPPSMPVSVIRDHMKQYGTVHSVGWERWKHYFPGTFNGVRVLRMHITSPIPSYITIQNEQSLVSYASQSKTCRFCNMSIHPKLKCGEASGEVARQPQSQSEIVNMTNFPAINQASTSTSTEQSNILPTQPQSQQKEAEKPKGKKHHKKAPLMYISDTNQTESDSDNSSETEMTTIANNQKRRMTTKTAKELKKQCQGSAPIEPSGEIDGINKSI